MAELNGIIDPQDQVVDDPNKAGDLNGGEPTNTGKPEGEPKPGEADGAKEQEVTEPARKKEQTPEENSAMREMRLKLEAMEAEKEQARRDAKYAKKYPDIDVSSEEELREMFEDEGITSWEDLDAYYENLEKAEKLEINPQLYQQLQQMQAKIDSLEKEKTDLASAKEFETAKEAMKEEYGDIFTQHEKEITDLAERMGMKNSQGLKASLATVLADKFPSIMKEMNEKLAKAKEEGVNEFVNKKKAEIPIEGSGAVPTNVGSKPKDSWEVARKSAMDALKTT
jgi:hypothetical protein